MAEEIFTVGSDRDNLKLVKIDSQDTVAELVRKINDNFQNIAAHGGGPEGKAGADGKDGLNGDGRTVLVYYNQTIDKSSTPEKPSSTCIWNRTTNEIEGLPTDSTGDGKDVWMMETKFIENAVIWISSGSFNADGSLVGWGNPMRISGPDGKPGVDGNLSEFIYLLTNNELTGAEYPDPASGRAALIELFENVEKNKTVKYKGLYTWYDNAQSIDAENYTYEYCWERSKKSDDSDWTYPSDAPFLWAHWGANGTDGDGVEYIFYIGESEDAKPARPTRTSPSKNGKDYQMDDFVPVGWFDDAQSVSATMPYEWVSIRKGNEGNWGDFSEPALWVKFGTDGKDGGNTFIIYYKSAGETQPATPTGGKWDKTTNKLDTTTLSKGWSTKLSFEADSIIWMSSGNFDSEGELVGEWTEPQRITGNAGKDGSNVQYIYLRKNAEIGTCDYPATNLIQGEYDPEDDDVKEQLRLINEFFDRVEAEKSVEYPDGSDIVWYDNAQGISELHKYEYVWSRVKAWGASTWIPSPKPAIWSKWGRDGKDGDGVEYIFRRETSNTLLTTISESAWSAWQNMNATTGDSDVDYIRKVIFNMEDFVPDNTWFTNDNKSKVRAILVEENNTSVINTFDTGKTISSKAYNWGNGFGLYVANVSDNWTDGPVEVSPEYPYEWVSRRKYVNGEWGSFSYPTLWANYSREAFTSYVFTVSNDSVDLSSASVLNGSSTSYTNPIPKDTVVGSNTYKWTDTPEVTADKTTVWMSKATFIKGVDITSDNPEWSSPSKMADSSKFNVEWIWGEDASGNIIEIDDNTASILRTNLKTDQYNYGTFYNANGGDENLAEAAFRNAIKTLGGSSIQIISSDEPKKAQYMATISYNNGMWSDWTFVDVKGEKGDAGASLSIKGAAKHELYYVYTGSTAPEYTEARSKTEVVKVTGTSKDFAVVYQTPPTDGTYINDLHVYVYTDEWIRANKDNKDTIKTALDIDIVDGYSLMTPISGHMVVWDGDSWMDCGKIKGDSGDSIVNKYAVDGSGSNNATVDGKGKCIRILDDDSTEIPKYIGFATYSSSSTKDLSSPATYIWHTFKGEDGLGYEYIYAATTADEAPSIPVRSNAVSTSDWDKNVNNTDFAPKTYYTTEISDVRNLQWEDDPMEVSETNKFVWMVNRKKDSDGKWGDFRGKDGKAKLWAKYVVDGEKGDPGDSAFSFDLTNDSWAIGVGSDKKINLSNALTNTTTLQGWYGSKSASVIITSVSITDVDNSTGISASKSGSTVTITIDKNKDISFEHNKTVNISFRISYATKLIEGETSFYIIGVAQGEDGESYELITSASAISKDKDGNYTPATISAWASSAASNAGFTLGCSIYNEEYTAYVENEEIILANLTNKDDVDANGITFYLYDTKGTIIDHETIPVVKSGPRGAGIRGPREWETGILYEGGDVENGDKFVDVITDGETYYYCEKTHICIPVYYNNVSSDPGNNSLTQYTKYDASNDTIKTSTGTAMPSVGQYKWVRNKDTNVSSNYIFSRVGYFDRNGDLIAWTTNNGISFSSTIGTSNGNVTLWESGEEFNLIATKLLLAENAAIEFISGNQLLLKEKTGVITAGAQSGKEVNFWAGTEGTSVTEEDIEDAPFRVYNDGKLVATDATIEGDITATSLNVENATITGKISANNIKVGTGDLSTTLTNMPTAVDEIVRKGLATDAEFISAVNAKVEVKELDLTSGNRHTTIDGNELSVKYQPGTDVVGEFSVHLLTSKEAEDYTVEGIEDTTGMPVLCLKFGERTFWLDPTSWIDRNVKAGYFMSIGSLYTLHACIQYTNEFSNSNVTNDIDSFKSENLANYSPLNEAAANTALVLVAGHTRNTNNYNVVTWGTQGSSLALQNIYFPYLPSIGYYKMTYTLYKPLDWSKNSGPLCVGQPDFSFATASEIAAVVNSQNEFTGWYPSGKFEVSPGGILSYTGDKMKDEIPDDIKDKILSVCNNSLYNNFYINRSMGITIQDGEYQDYFTNLLTIYIIRYSYIKDGVETSDKLYSPAFVMRLSNPYSERNGNITQLHNGSFETYTEVEFSTYGHLSSLISSLSRWFSQKKNSAGLNFEAHYTSFELNSSVSKSAFKASSNPTNDWTSGSDFDNFLTALAQNYTSYN